MPYTAFILVAFGLWDSFSKTRTNTMATATPTFNLSTLYGKTTIYRTHVQLRGSILPKTPERTRSFPSHLDYMASAARYL